MSKRSGSTAVLYLTLLGSAMLLVGMLFSSIAIEDGANIGAGIIGVIGIILIVVSLGLYFIRRSPH